MKKRFLDFYRTWEGTPYWYGGNSRRGIDCSAFVQRLYRETLGIHIPRTTRQQWRTGIPIPRDQLQAGDMVFFHTTEKELHVGVYIEKARFIHASTSQGVTISSLTQPYWKHRFIGARRILVGKSETNSSLRGSNPVPSSW